MKNHRSIRPLWALGLGALGVIDACTSVTVENGPAGGGVSAVGAAGSGASAGKATTGANSGGRPAGTSTGIGGIDLANIPAVGGFPPVTWEVGADKPTSLSLPYTDDFEDGTMDYPWMRDDSGTLNPTNWPIVVDSANTANHVLELGTSDSATWEVGGDLKWTDQSLTVRVRFADTSTVAYVAVRFAGFDMYYFALLDPGSKPKIRARTTDGSSTSTSDVCTGTVNFAVTAGTWYTVRLTAQGSSLSLTIDGTAICSGTSSVIPSGNIALGSDGGGKVAFDDLNVTAP
jgi:hypothetical protein